MRLDPRWADRLRQEFGDQVRLSWNADVGRWQFDILCVDGQHRAEFWHHTHHPVTGVKLEPDESGRLPFKDLNDTALEEAIRNLHRSYLGNPHDGAGTARGHVRQVKQYNDDLRARTRAWRRDLLHQVVRGRVGKMRGDAFSAGGITVVSPVGSPKEA